jgi:hypothetical protein
MSATLSSPMFGGGAEPPGPREARPEDKLREAKGGVGIQCAPTLPSVLLRFAPQSTSPTMGEESLGRGR